MPIGWDPQRPPGMFPWLDLLESRLPGAAYYVFGGIGCVFGYFFGLMQGVVPLPVCIALGLLIGLLFVPIALKMLAFLLCGALVAAAAVATFWLMNNQAGLKHQAAPASVVHTAPSKTAHKLIDQLFPGGR